MIENINLDLQTFIPISSNEWLREWRARGWSKFCQTGFPTRKLESWRYGRPPQENIQPIESKFKINNDALIMPQSLEDVLSEFQGGSSQKNSRKENHCKENHCKENHRKENHRKENHRKENHLSHRRIRDFLNECYNSDKDFSQQAFVNLNHAFAKNPLIIYVAPGKHLDLPLETKYKIQNELPGTAYTQLWVYVDEGASLRLIENFSDDTEFSNGSSINHNHVTYIKCAADSKLYHYYSHHNRSTQSHLYFSQVSLDRNSEYKNFSLNLGTAHQKVDQQVRQEVHTHLEGTAARSQFNLINLGEQKQQIDCYLPVYYHTTKAQCVQNCYQVVDHRARAMFYGKIIIPPKCVGAVAHQLNRNLIIGDRATINARPELEIFTDEVVCSHGSATGGLDPELIHYLQTRGITEQQAKVMLLMSFLTNNLPPEDDHKIYAEWYKILETWAQKRQALQEKVIE